ncbi:hypothetical protein [Spirosoma radiotolerans]|uniref:Uncharacterized protein n=1 Tax=Spirosoma radiotolerans TaxID=1379870 RepID=A0A0E3ZU80_9BACT|nr:hypothetical protein [Spirosoma radiotolerans]AKD54409.1 hypothetical protein SD10_05275 [Spirosoma radiotolerans]
MERQGITYLIEQLIRQKLSKEEFDELLASLHYPAMRQAYSDILEAYFTELLNQHEYQPEPGKQPE